MTWFSAPDIRYVIAEYRTMAELCDGRATSAAQAEALVGAGRLPGAAYVLPSGERRYPPDYFALVDEFGLDGLPAGFRTRYAAAGGSAAAAEDDWQGYLSGQFGVCLRAVTPESMVAKSRLVARVAELTGAPSPDDAGWRGALRAAVSELDSVLRPFTDHDRRRWGATSRDRFVTHVRERWPEVFDHTLLGA